ncbi:MAG: sulfite exporter TauE/SafE family protein [Gammaproteobacteria bacterium]|nr:sulfite exporter TauE/SafE family protein [Gammaproteobacteria bacterium]
MDWIDTGLFLFLVMLGAYVQTITGFAMGLLIMGGVTILNLAPIAFSAAVVSILSLLNAMLALRYSLKYVNWKTVGYTCAGLLPGLVVGFLILGLLGDSAYIWLRRILGVVIIIAGVLLTLKPEPWHRASGRWATSLTGVAGGLIGGMFSTGGAPIAFFMYRQPVELNIIRATLLAVFVVTTFSRTVAVAVDGQLTRDILAVSGVGIPLVLITTLFARKISPVNADITIRKTVFILLILIGAFLVIA